MKVLILATVSYGKAQITQSWTFLEVEKNAYLLLHEANDGNIVIPLDIALVKDMSPGMTPSKFYNGTLNAADAVNLTMT